MCVGGGAGSTQCHRHTSIYLVQLPHGSTGRGDDVVHEEEKRVLSSEVDPFPNEEVELPDWKREGRESSEAGGEKVIASETQR